MYSHYPHTPIGLLLGAVFLRSVDAAHSGRRLACRGACVGPGTPALLGGRLGIRKFGFWGLWKFGNSDPWPAEIRKFGFGVLGEIRKFGFGVFGKLEIRVGFSALVGPRTFVKVFVKNVAQFNKNLAKKSPNSHFSALFFHEFSHIFFLVAETKNPKIRAQNSWYKKVCSVN